MKRIYRATVLVALISLATAGTAAAAQPTRSSCYSTVKLSTKCNGRGDNTTVHTSATGTTLVWSERDCWRTGSRAIHDVIAAPVKVRKDGTFLYTGLAGVDSFPNTTDERGTRATISGTFVTPTLLRIVSQCSSPSRGTGPKHTLVLTRRGTWKAPKTIARQPLPGPPTPTPAPLPAHAGPMTAAEATAAVLAWPSMAPSTALPGGGTSTRTDISAPCTVTDADHATCSVSYTETIDGTPGLFGAPSVRTTQRCEGWGIEVIRNPPVAGGTPYVVHATTFAACTPVIGPPPAFTPGP
jgi:hypothetical protein